MFVSLERSSGKFEYRIEPFIIEVNSMREMTFIERYTCIEFDED